jgi:hypothetical protein
MKLAAERLLDQPPTSFLPGRDHQGEGLGPPLLDARLRPMGADGVHDQRHEWHPRLRRTEPPQRIQKADALHAEVLQGG